MLGYFREYLRHFMSRDREISKLISYALDSDGIFLFTFASTMAFLTSPIQLVEGAFPTEVKQLGQEGVSAV
jgi:hypothetical protein